MRNKNLGTHCNVSKFPAIAASSVYKIKRKVPRYLVDNESSSVHKSIKISGESRNIYSRRSSGNSFTN